MRLDSRRLLVILIILLALSGSWRVVYAHALLVRSLPEAGAELAIPPATIELWFSEPLEDGFSNAHLVDAQGNEISGVGSTVDEADRTHMTLALSGLTPGIYTVVYRTLSQADGHEWLGSFPITILNPDGTRPAGSQEANALTVDAGRGELPTPLETFSRWLALLGSMGVLGGIVFQHVVAPVPHKEPDLTTIISRSARLSLLVSLGMILVGTALQLLTKTNLLSEPGAWLALLTNTRTGNLLLARQLLAVLLLLLIITPLARSAKRTAPLQWLMLVLSLALLTTFSLGSHAAALPARAWAILGDFLHLAMSAIWLGGLGLLAIVAWQMRSQTTKRAAALRQMVQRFSDLAMISVVLLLISGYYSSLMQLDSLALLWRSTYGRLLLAKILLVSLVLAVAFLNHRLIRGRRAATWVQTYYPRFLRQIWGEALLGLVILLVVALLVQTPVPQPTAADAAPAASYFERLLEADDLTMHLQISPNQPGNNRYVVHLYHEDNSAIGEVQLVRLSFVHQTAELGQSTLELAAQGGDLFAAEGAYQNQAGPWDVSLYVRRRGMDDLLVTTTVEMAVP